jgi:hypothetical protein
MEFAAWRRGEVVAGAVRVGHDEGPLATLLCRGGTRRDGRQHQEAVDHRVSTGGAGTAPMSKDAVRQQRKSN